MLHQNLLVASGSKGQQHIQSFRGGQCLCDPGNGGEPTRRAKCCGSTKWFLSRAVALIGTVVPVLTWIRDHENIAIDIEKIRDALELPRDLETGA